MALFCVWAENMKYWVKLRESVYVHLRSYRVSHKFGPKVNSVIWQNMKKCKVVADHVFPISSVRILFLRRAITPLQSWHDRNKILQRFCHVDMMVKQSFNVQTWVMWFCWLATVCHSRPHYKIVSPSCQPGNIAVTFYYGCVKSVAP
jgi:hypothetical protein